MPQLKQAFFCRALGDVAGLEVSRVVGPILGELPKSGFLVS